jgi:hypothetical protein
MEEHLKANIRLVTVSVRKPVIYGNQQATFSCGNEGNSRHRVSTVNSNHPVVCTRTFGFQRIKSMPSIKALWNKIVMQYFLFNTAIAEL